jgi:hypothetical protein
MSSKAALPLALLVVVFLTAWPTTELLAQNCPGCSEPAKVVHPNGFGPESYARWKPRVGELDSNLKTRFAMLLVHRTSPAATAEARAVVAVEGFDGEDPNGFTLAYDHPTTSICTPTVPMIPGNPRWSVRYRVPNTTIDRRFVFACNDTVQSDGIMTGTASPVMLPGEQPLEAPAWDRERVVLTTTLPVIIVSLSIQWDFPCTPALCPGEVLVDNIMVRPSPLGPAFTWTAPFDNGTN